MIAPLRRSKPRRPGTPAWHLTLLAMLPAIREHAVKTFTDLDPEGREEAIAEVVAYAVCAIKALDERGKLDLAYPSVLAMFGEKRVRDGRKVGTPLNVNDVSSEYCQLRNRATLVRLDKFDPETGQWKEVLLEDRRAGPADTAAARIDVDDWFATLRPRDREIATALAVGERACDVAEKFHLSRARISQKRRKYFESWQGFQGEAVPMA